MSEQEVVAAIVKWLSKERKEHIARGSTYLGAECLRIKKAIERGDWRAKEQEASDGE